MSPTETEVSYPEGDPRRAMAGVLLSGTILGAATRRGRPGHRGHVPTLFRPIVRAARPALRCVWALQRNTQLTLRSYVRPARFADPPLAARARSRAAHRRDRPLAFKSVAPDYAAKATVLLVPPDSVDNPGGSRHLLLGGLTPARDIVIRALNADEVHNKVSYRPAAARATE